MGEMPISIEMPDIGWVLGDGWKHVRTGVLGELFITAWLETDFSPQKASIAATGWGGDAYSLFEGPDGQGVLVLATVWDSEQDAEEFFVTVQRHAEAPLQFNMGRLAAGSRGHDHFSAQPDGPRRAKRGENSANLCSDRRTH